MKVRGGSYLLKNGNHGLRVPGLGLDLMNKMCVSFTEGPSPPQPAALDNKPPTKSN